MRRIFKGNHRSAGLKPPPRLLSRSTGLAGTPTRQRRKNRNCMAKGYRNRSRTSVP
jgi:hypothetical protein